MTAGAAIRTGHRPCTDAEYNQQRRCFNCAFYSFKSYANDDENSGKCFVQFQIAPVGEKVLWTEGKEICDHFKFDGVVDGHP